MIPENERLFLEKIASDIKARKLDIPLTVFMESLYPLRRVLDSCMDLAHPLFSLVISDAKLQQFQEILRQPKRYDYFLKQLEK
jgi:hypothetical protein